jgi:hypothetical protein
VQGIFSSPGSGAVQAFGLMFMAAALRAGNFLLDGSIEMTRLKLLPIARSDRVLET